MEFEDLVKVLGERCAKLGPQLSTEEATKTSLVLPFIQALGYDIFNPEEVVPEFNAQTNVKKDQRVDYALLKDGNPIILIECKTYGSDLGIEYVEQLKRYFPFVKTAKIGVLTDGNRYRFFTDLEEPNVMDNDPYMEFSLEKPDKNLLSKLLMLRKEKFNDDDAIKDAEQLKYTNQFKKLLAQQAEDPDDDFVKFFAKQVWSGQLTQNVKAKLTPLLKNAIKQFVEDRIASRLQKAAEKEEKEKLPVESPVEVEPEPVSNGIETTEEELLGFNIIRAILASETDVVRIHIRDAKTYCAVLLDDNNRKPIARLYFNNPSNLRVSLGGAKKDEPAVSIDKVEDLFRYANDLKAVVKFYDSL